MTESEVIALHGNAAQAEHHFNNLQMEYRKLASVWLIAVFSGTGFLISKDFQNEDYKELLISGVGFAGSIGVCLLWHLDLIVYQNLLRGHFLAALRLEKEHKFLPKVRSIMLVLDSGKGAAKQVMIFYVASSFVCYFVGLLAIITALIKHARQPTADLAFVTGGVMTLVILLVNIRIYMKTKNFPSLRKAMAKKFQLTAEEILN